MPIQGTVDFSQFRAEEWGSTHIYRMGYYRGPKSYSSFSNGGTGDPATPGDFKLGQLFNISFDSAFSSGAGAILQPKYVLPIHGGPTASGIVWFNPVTGLEVANGTDLSGYVSFFDAVGL